MSNNEDFERLLSELLSAEGDAPQAKGAEEEPQMPAEIPILPLRGIVVYPFTTVPLTVGQPRSVRLVDDVSSGSKMLGLVTAHDPEMEKPGPDEVYRVGTLAVIHRMFRAPDGTIRLLVQGLRRFRVDEFTDEEPYLRARISPIAEDEDNSLEVEALVRNIQDVFRRMTDIANNMPSELVATALNIQDPVELVYSIASYTRIDLEKAQSILEITPLREKLRMLYELISKELELLELGRKIQTEAQTEMEKMQRDYFLREQMKVIQRELSESGDELEEVEEFRARIAKAGMTDEARKEAERELDRLAKLSIASAEYGVIRTYLEWLTAMPWNVRTDDNLDVSNARNVLNEDHYGLQDIKERILEFLAVRKLRADRANEFKQAYEDSVRRERLGAILCFVGPPGVGKTSLGASIARAMGRKFIRLSLGGVRDEAEIRGFRRTYIGAMPGRIVHSLRRIGTRNPLIMLDEVDKLGRDFRGDPASALLELLDPEQNAEFRDTYLDVAFDLSEVMFITTANSLDTIPLPLLDRMEIIHLSGYTEPEKLAIAEQYLVPRQLRENGLRKEEVQFNQDALLSLIREHTREAGVRSLEREIGRVARKVVTRIAEGTETVVTIDAPAVKELLGKPRFGYQTELNDRLERPGVATGLVWTPVGGDVLFIEASTLSGGKGNLTLTGQLGEVMQESARIAVSFVRSQATRLGIDAKMFTENDLHLHVPAGAIPKDGPSAGVTMAIALTSLLTGIPTVYDVAMTGELTLNGQVLRVGGIKDKVLAAHRIGAKTVILPQKNERDLDDLPSDVKESLRFVLVSRYEEALEVALPSVFARHAQEK